MTECRILDPNHASLTSKVVTDSRRLGYGNGWALINERDACRDVAFRGNAVDTEGFLGLLLVESLVVLLEGRTFFRPSIGSVAIWSEAIGIPGILSTDNVDLDLVLCRHLHGSNRVDHNYPIVDLLLASLFLRLFIFLVFSETARQQHFFSSNLYCVCVQFPIKQIYSLIL